MERPYYYHNEPPMYHPYREPYRNPRAFDPNQVAAIVFILSSAFYFQIYELYKTESNRDDILKEKIEKIEKEAKETNKTDEQKDDMLKTAKHQHAFMVSLHGILPVAIAGSASYILFQLMG